MAGQIEHFIKVLDSSQVSDKEPIESVFKVEANLRSLSIICLSHSSGPVTSVAASRTSPRRSVGAKGPHLAMHRHHMCKFVASLVSFNVKISSSSEEIMLISSANLFSSRCVVYNSFLSSLSCSSSAVAHPTACLHVTGSDRLWNPLKF